MSSYLIASKGKVTKYARLNTWNVWLLIKLHFDIFLLGWNASAALLCTCMQLWALNAAMNAEYLLHVKRALLSLSYRHLLMFHESSFHYIKLERTALNKCVKTCLNRSCLTKLKLLPIFRMAAPLPILLQSPFCQLISLA